ncbi:MAG: SDR family NAD(P)-dependent oxidoreductase, partial [Dehalococcoidia bacterium]|nr:SDR family NAD(P)-dependent oxidoreductase [Dehalococcoidia bacterium]
MRLANKVAIVTGSGHGIGREMAFVLADEGASVVVTARTRSEIDAVAKEIRAKSGKALAIPTDVRVEEQVNGMVQKTIDKFGKIDILVNNAGGALNSFYTLVVDLKFEDWKEVQEANVT